MSIEERLEIIEDKLDLIIEILNQQEKPLKVMEDHVYNVEESITRVASRVPFLNRILKLTVFPTFRNLNSAPQIQNKPQIIDYVCNEKNRGIT